MASHSVEQSVVSMAFRKVDLTDKAVDHLVAYLDMHLVDYSVYRWVGYFADLG